jgi:hypothetical protein
MMTAKLDREAQGAVAVDRFRTSNHGEGGL